MRQTLKGTGPGRLPGQISSIPYSDTRNLTRYSIQKHNALKAGTHYDLRILGSNGKAWSWALRHIPDPGNKVLAVRQPDHEGWYMNWSGNIPKGEYGAGNVSVYASGQIEILKSSPDKINFNIYKERQTYEYSLIHTNGNNWLLLNRTLTRENQPNLPATKPKYKEIKSAKEFLTKFISKRYMWQPKIDGAHILEYLRKSKNPELVSYRPAKGGTGLINHTFKVDGLYKHKVPASLDNTILRGEVYAQHNGKALLAKDIGALLNSRTPESLKKQRTMGRLKMLAFDIARYKGKDVANAPYSEKWQMLNALKNRVKNIELPKAVIEPTAKLRLFNKIKNGMYGKTKEGLVAWDSLTNNVYKYKFKKENDVYIRRFFSGGGKLQNKGVGGFYYSLTKNGPVVGKVGTGLSDRLRHDMYLYPDKYIGKVAIISSLEQHPSGALRAPAFKGWHLDKNAVIPEILK